MKVTWLGALMLGAFGGWFAKPIEQYAVMHYPRKCIEEIRIDDDTYLEMPLVNGLPVEKQARVFGEHVTYNATCNAATIKIVKN